MLLGVIGPLLGFQLWAFSAAARRNRESTT
jgi:hypothetical protein